MITLQQIEQLMISELGYDFTEYNKSRKRERVYIRSIFFKLSKEYTIQSLDTIGSRLNKTHATVINALDVFENEVKVYEPDFYQVYQNLKNKLDEILVCKLVVKDVNLVTYGIKI